MEKEAKAFARKLGEGAPLAMQAILRAVTRGLEMPIEEGVKIEVEGSTQVNASEDAMEGARAFIEKRPPRFQGR